ncbi:hypothetical protein CGRA01v4_02959 [Colletotrichum graminicola]|nr:hypothetical protein CGRA01v4_02959 [Colletotrichum graminicola]
MGKKRRGRPNRMVMYRVRLAVFQPCVHCRVLVVHARYPKLHGTSARTA